LNAVTAFGAECLKGGEIYFYSDREKIWYAGGKWDPRRLWFFHVGIGHHDNGKCFNETVETEFVTGCALFLSKEVIDTIGLLDERFFLVFEEADWCYRARKKGYKCIVVPRAVLWHNVAASFHGEMSQLRTYFSFRNCLLWAEKNANWMQRIAIHVSIYKGFWSRFVRLVLSNNSNSGSVRRRYWSLQVACGVPRIRRGFVPREITGSDVSATVRNRCEG